jgi:hypothetical protein
LRGKFGLEGDTYSMIGKRGIALAAIFVGIAVVACFLVQPREPRYQGKRLSAWLKDLESWNGDTNDPPFLAFSKMGTNAIPALLKVIESGGPGFERAISKFNRKQSLVKIPFGTPWHQVTAATWAFHAIGTNARPALPTLTNWLFGTNLSRAYTSSSALAGIGADAIPSLLAALTNQNWVIRHAAASGLGWVRSDFDSIVPSLLASLDDENRTVRYAVVISLGQLHWRPERVVPALTNELRANDNLLRMLILNSLGEFEGQATSAVPVIMGALKDSDEFVRDSAAAALKKIDPEAVKRTGVTSDPSPK